MIKIVSPWFIRAFRGPHVIATTFFPFVVIFKSRYWANDRATVNHEAIHGWQMIECLMVGMWLVLFLHAGRDNPFEKEANANETNFDYLKTRKLWAWRKYL